MNRKWISSIFGHFEKTHISYIINSSFTCFLEHFMFPRKQSIADWPFDQVFGAYLCRCNFNRLTLFEYYDNWLFSVRMSTVEKWKLKELIITRNWIGNTGGNFFYPEKPVKDDVITGSVSLFYPDPSKTSFLVFSSITWQSIFFIRISLSENSLFYPFSVKGPKFFASHQKSG